MSSRRSRRPPSLNLSISSRETTPPPTSDIDASDDEHMASSTYTSSSACSQRPASVAMSQAPYCMRRPTLAEILSNTAPPPYTLSAFMAYLSQNHCLETLEFTMDASRYRKHFHSLNPANSGPMTPDSESCQYVRMLWQKLLDAYIAPNGPREVNLPYGIREKLLSIPNQRMPPPPESLDPAVNIVYDLMEESVLMPFLNSCSPCQSYAAPWEVPIVQSNEDLYMSGSLDERLLRRHINSNSPPPPHLDFVSNSYSPSSSARSRGVSPFSPSFGWAGPMPNRQFSSLSAGAPPNASGDTIATDDSSTGALGGSSSSMSPMTPPSTPPTSDTAGSPKHASKPGQSWKRMTGKLSWKKKTGFESKTL